MSNKSKLITFYHPVSKKQVKMEVGQRELNMIIERRDELVALLNTETDSYPKLTKAMLDLARIIIREMATVTE